MPLAGQVGIIIFAALALGAIISILLWLGRRAMLLGVIGGALAVGQVPLVMLLLSRGSYGPGLGFFILLCSVLLCTMGVYTFFRLWNAQREESRSDPSGR